jgi:hypothetical protein
MGRRLDAYQVHPALYPKECLVLYVEGEGSPRGEVRALQRVGAKLTTSSFGGGARFIVKLAEPGEVPRRPSATILGRAVYEVVRPRTLEPSQLQTSS